MINLVSDKRFSGSDTDEGRGRDECPAQHGIIDTSFTFLTPHVVTKTHQFSMKPTCRVAELRPTFPWRHRHRQDLLLEELRGGAGRSLSWTLDLSVHASVQGPVEGDEAGGRRRKL